VVSEGTQAEDGVIPAEYQLSEMALSEYLPCTKANVEDSDATIVFTYGPLKGGSLKTASYAHRTREAFSTCGSGTHHA